MKYERVTKIKRNQAIRDMREQRTELSLQEIADMFGISRGRVYQILNNPRFVQRERRDQTG